jgi:uncharacterized protein (TIGR03435 family)
MNVNRWIALALAAPLLAMTVSMAQTAAPRLEFEVASIRPSAPMTAEAKIGVHVDGAQVSCTYLSLKDYIQSAYNVKNYQVVGPEWVGSERFDIAAKLPAGATKDQVPAMLQSMLEDRFKMKTHRESKDFPVYALIVAKAGLKLKESSDPDGAAAAAQAPGRGGDVNVTAQGGRGGVSVNLGNGSFFTFADNKMEGRKLAMQSFADTLARFMDRPVVDMTELKGVYDFTLEFTQEDYMAMLIRSALAAGVVMPPQALKMLELSSGDSLLTALAAQGLKLEARKAPLPVLVIDRMEKTPSDN